MPSKMLKCGDCGNNFEWSEKDQKFYASKGYGPPKRCKSCRDRRKARHSGGKKGGGGQQGAYGRSNKRGRAGSRR